MKNEKFVFKVLRDSIPEPSDFTAKKFSCLDFFHSTESFIEHNFAGAIRVDFPETCKGYINVSPLGFAYFIRVLLSDVYGTSVTIAHVTASDSELIMTVENASELKSYEKLADAARRSGFSVEKTDGNLIIRTPIKSTAEMFVYARDILLFINYYYEVFLMQ